MSRTVEVVPFLLTVSNFLYNVHGDQYLSNLVRDFAERRDIKMMSEEDLAREVAELINDAYELGLEDAVISRRLTYND